MTPPTRYKILAARAQALAGQARELWDRACKYDDISPFAIFAVFSKRNPHVPRHSRIVALTQKSIIAARNMLARIPIKNRPGGSTDKTNFLN